MSPGEQAPREGGANPYARLNRKEGLDYAVGEAVVSTAAVHGGRGGVVVRPSRHEPGRYMVWLTGDALAVGVDPRRMARLSAPVVGRGEALGLDVVGHCDEIPDLVIRGADGALRLEPVPSELVARDGRGLIVWRGPDRRWPFAGFDASRVATGVSFHRWSHGGRFRTLGAALDWYAAQLGAERPAAVEQGSA